jgi:tRNA-Thr(GGU) m(6)t(6)A37 methyltransferase TsaA
MSIHLNSIGTVHSDRSEAIDDDWDAVPSHIELKADLFDDEALQGLESFSHAEIIFHFHTRDEASINLSARHPRGNEDWPKIGIFAQRASGRPNRLGVTMCKILRVEGRKLYLKGLDAIDGTPVLDIKPVMQGFLPRGTVSEPDWAGEIMAEYW